ncbi:DeoR/GlpR family DNA-binding transcription regulator [Clostridium magnum]|uniref:Glucitol operon repressor n=1 Tax=Clostridium magnum DSM 2767 TaxID=1121326 RepID=A0A162SAY2_9CLOT|nr:DeoR/GlpR family DNA-binding transcription regulator [Clostridium magnum]KZL91000.1 glucitol operon repressor [Clostridium magnum DSM 2767]SHI66151.1 transcriptional regulator, DeoR family [Clostridium magnum DSM 2767]
MFAVERIRLIKELLTDKKHIDVSTLSSLLNVSEVTIRRDLEKLENQGFLTRTHGGAVINDTSVYEDIPYDSNAEEDPLLQYRSEISDIAVQLIEDNDVILLSPGPTNLQIAKKLSSKRNVTILTNDLNIAGELSSNAGNKVILPGGDLDPVTLNLSGKLTEENIRNFYVNQAFIEVDGVSLARGYTLQDINKTSVVKEMLNISHQKIIVCPYKAFDFIAFSQLAPISIANKVITNPQISDNYKNYFFENNIQLFTAFNTYEGGI